MMKEKKKDAQKQKNNPLLFPFPFVYIFIINWFSDRPSLGLLRKTSFHFFQKKKSQLHSFTFMPIFSKYSILFDILLTIISFEVQPIDMEKLSFIRFCRKRKKKDKKRKGNIHLDDFLVFPSTKIFNRGDLFSFHKSSSAPFSFMCLKQKASKLTFFGEKKKRKKKKKRKSYFNPSTK